MRCQHLVRQRSVRLGLLTIFLAFPVPSRAQLTPKESGRVSGIPYGTDRWKNLEPEFRDALERAFERANDAGLRPRFESGYRSQSEQDQLVKDYKAGKGSFGGKPAKVSPHTSQIAADVSIANPADMGSWLEILETEDLYVPLIDVATYGQIDAVHVEPVPGSALARALQSSSRLAGRRYEYQSVFLSIQAQSRGGYLKPSDYARGRARSEFARRAAETLRNIREQRARREAERQRQETERRERERQAQRQRERADRDHSDRADQRREARERQERDRERARDAARDRQRERERERSRERDIRGDRRVLG
jgi:hypothetical protein